MRILILNYEFPPVGGGGGRVSAALAREFVLKGHTVKVLTSACDTLARHEEIDGYTVKRFSALRRHRDRCSIPEMIAYILLGIIPTLKEVWHFKPDIINAHFGIPTGPLALITRRPYVLTIHAGDVPGFMPNEIGIYHHLIRPLTQLIWRQAARVVAVSNGIRRVAHQTAPKLTIDVIPNGIYARSNQPTREIPQKPYKLLFVGRISDQKGLDYLIHSLGRLAGRDDWQLTLVGDGPKCSKIEQLIAHYHLQDRVEITGWLEHEIVQGFYQTHDIFVLPSITEGMPLVMLEAMCFAMPLIGTDVNGIQDLIEPSKNGWLVPPLRIDTLTHAIEEALETHPEALWKIGQASQHRVLSDFTWDKLSTAYLELFETIVRQS